MHTHAAPHDVGGGSSLVQGREAHAAEELRGQHGRETRARKAACKQGGAVCQRRRERTYPRSRVAGPRASDCSKLHSRS